MVITQPDYYESFSCIAGDCPDSCCIGWQVIPDEEHLEFYRNLKGDLGEEIRKGIVDIDGEPSFALCNGRCCMLREDGLCKIQYSLGEEALSTVCGFYPRFVTELGLIREQGLSISCPEVARMILHRQEPLSLRTYTTDDPLRYYHDIEPDRLLAVRQGRDDALQLMQDRKVPIGKRMEQVLRIALGVDEVEYDSHVEAMTDEAYFRFRKELYDLFFSLERLRSDWTDILREGFKGPALCELDNGICWEQLFSYYLFKYSLRSAMDETFLECISMAILSVLLLQELFAQGKVELVYLVQLYAKETEHNDDNFRTILDAVSEHSAFTPEILLSLLYRYF